MLGMPAYELSSFIAACQVGGQVFVTRGALQTATSDFGLTKDSDVMAFIGDGGIERPTFVNSVPWVNNPKPENKILVDSYSFYTGTKFGYLAFCYNDNTQKWMLKSMKKNDQTGPCLFVVADAFKKAGLLGK